MLNDFKLKPLTDFATSKKTTSACLANCGTCDLVIAITITAVISSQAHRLQTTTTTKYQKMVKNENGPCWPQINTNKLLMNKRMLLNKDVCRAITFGKCRDVDESNEFLRIQLDNLRRKERTRWNFDFYNERPCSSDGSDLDEDSESEKSEPVTKSSAKTTTTTTTKYTPHRRRYQWTKGDSLVSS